MGVIVFSIVLTLLVTAILVPGIILIVKGIRAGGNKRRIAIIIPCAIIFTFITAISILIFDLNHTIGTFTGSEYDIIMIDGVQYKSDYDNVYSSSDKEKYLGKVIYSGSSKNKTDPMYVWSIKGTDEYIYALWLYDGTVFKKTD